MNQTLLRISVSCLIGVFLMIGMVGGQNKFGQPKTILHVIAPKWKADSTPEQRQKVIDGVKVMAAKIPGITNIWLIKIKAQAADTAFAMEFKDQAAFDAYVEHPAHKEWEAIYLPIRELSTTQDVTN